MTTNEKISNAQKMIAGFLTLILGRKTKVVWGRNASCDSSKTVYLPRPKVGDAAECALMTRRALHEAGHCELTDFEAIKDLDPSVHVLMNALEDIRMEHQQSGMYRGASLILSRGLPELFIQNQQRLDVTSPEDASKLIALNVLVKAARKLLTKNAYGSAADGLVDMGDQLLGPEGRQAVDVATTNLAQCANTADVVKIAKVLWAALQSIKPENPDQSSENSADQQREGEKSGEPEKGAPDAQQSSDKPSGDANSKSQTSEGSQSSPDGPARQGGEPAGDNSSQSASNKGNPRVARLNLLKLMLHPLVHGKRARAPLPRVNQSKPRLPRIPNLTSRSSQTDPARRHKGVQAVKMIPQVQAVPMMTCPLREMLQNLITRNCHLKMTRIPDRTQGNLPAPRRVKRQVSLI